MIFGQTGLFAKLSGLIFQVPVDPDGPEAHDWIIQELSKPEYQAAKPTWWDLLAQSILDWFTSLKFDFSGVPGGFFTALILIIVLALIVAAFLIFGVPRLRARSKMTGALLGENEIRSSDELRAAAKKAAQAGDWTLAIEEMYRAIAKSMLERVLVNSTPGTTANGFAAAASGVFPQFAQELKAGATAFDRVRYLGGAGSEEEFRSLARLDENLESSKPAIKPPDAMRELELVS